MLKFLRKIFTKDKIIIIENEELVSKISELIYYKDLDTLFFSPTNKLYLINMYTSNFGDLINNFYNKDLYRQLITINIYSYFYDTKLYIQSDLEKIYKCLLEYKPNSLIIHDLYELVNVFEYFKSLEDNSVGK